MHLKVLTSVVLSRHLVMIVSSHPVVSSHYKSHTSFIYPHLAPQVHAFQITSRAPLLPDYIAEPRTINAAFKRDISNPAANVRCECQLCRAISDIGLKSRWGCILFRFFLFFFFFFFLFSSREDASMPRTFAGGVPATKSSFDFHDNGRELECTSFRGDRQASGLSIFNERNSRSLRHYDDPSSAP